MVNLGDKAPNFTLPGTNGEFTLVTTLAQDGTILYRQNGAPAPADILKALKTSDKE